VHRKETKRGSRGELREYIVIINEVRWGKIGQIDRDELEPSMVTTEEEEKIEEEYRFDRTRINLTQRKEGNRERQ